MCFRDVKKGFLDKCEEFLKKTFASGHQMFTDAFTATLRHYKRAAGADDSSAADLLPTAFDSPWASVFDLDIRSVGALPSSLSILTCTVAF